MVVLLHIPCYLNYWFAIAEPLRALVNTFSDTELIWLYEFWGHGFLDLVIG